MEVHMFVLVVVVVVSVAWWVAWRRQQSSVPRRGTLAKRALVAATPNGAPQANEPGATTTGASERAFLYDAFISYRHRKSDHRWARWLHHKLESYRTPAELV